MKKQGTGIREQGTETGRVAQVPRFWGPGSGIYFSRLIGTAIILLAAAVAVAPQLARGVSCGHDFDFHLVSWLDCLNGWRHGIPYPHWAASANFGAGEPRFVFYPPLTWMLGATLGFVFPWTLVPAALTFLLLAGTGLATRALAREMLPDGAATLAGCAALFSGYALYTAYERSAFGELAGGLWIPLLLLYILRDRNPDGSPWQRAFDGSAAPLALAVAGCWLSNAPLGVMGCYLLAAVALVLVVLGRSWAPALRAGIGAALGLALSSFYLIPAAWEQRWVDIRQAIDDPGLRIESSWLFARHANPLLKVHDQELRTVSIIAVAMIAVALAGLLISWLRGRISMRPNFAPEERDRSCVEVSHPCDKNVARMGHPSGEDFKTEAFHETEPLAVQRSSSDAIARCWWLPLALIPPAVLILQLPFSLPLWNLLPEMRFLQFPWRWLVALEAPMAVFFAAALWPRESARRRRRVGVAAVCAAVFLAATLLAGASFYQACYPEDTVAGVMAAIGSGAGTDGYDEYAPPGAKNALVATGLPDACLAADPAIPLGIFDTPGANPDWWVEQGSCAATLRRQLDQPEHKRLATFISNDEMVPNELTSRRNVPTHARYLILRLRGYPAWRIAVNGYPIAALPRREDGLIVVPVWPGRVALTVDWTTTPDVTAGRWLCVLAVLLLIVLWLLERKLCRLHL